MPRRPPVPPFVAAALWLLAAGGLVWQWHHAGRAAQEARAAWANARDERARLARALPPATSAGSAAIDAAVAQAEAGLAARRQELVAATATADGPETPLDSWYQVVATQDRLWALADERAVALKPGEQFGLASHRRTGPAEADLPAVTRQRAVIELLVATLLAAGPPSLLSVQRERPGEAPAGEPNDFFRMEPRLSLRMPGSIETAAFRLEFTGSTAVLRTFLNSLAGAPDLLFVRSVEAAPLAGAGGRGARPEAAADAATRPVVAPELARFVVVIEHAVLTPPPST